MSAVGFTGRFSRISVSTIPDRSHSANSVLFFLQGIACARPRIRASQLGRRRPRRPAQDRRSMIHDQMSDRAPHSRKTAA